MNLLSRNMCLCPTERWASFHTMCRNAWPFNLGHDLFRGQSLGTFDIISEEKKERRKRERERGKRKKFKKVQIGTTSCICMKKITLMNLL